MVLINEEYRRINHIDRLTQRKASPVYFFEGDDLIGTGYTKPQGLRCTLSYMYLCTTCGEIWGRVYHEESTWTVVERPCRVHDSHECNDGQGTGFGNKHCTFLGNTGRSLDSIREPISVILRDFNYLTELYGI